MHAFPKSSRLRHRLEFRQTLDQGFKTVCPLVVLFAKPTATTTPQISVQAATPPLVLPAPAQRPLRIGLIVSRKVGNSVVRNRVKRHLREAYRLMRPELATVATLCSTDVVVIARADAAKASAADIASGLRHCLQRLSRQLQRHESK